MGRFKKRRFHELTQLERVSIVHDIKVKFETWKDTMRKYWVGHGTINALIIKINKNKDYLDEIWAKINDKEDKVAKITHAAQTMLDLEQNIMKASTVKHHCEKCYDIKVPLHRVQHVMRRRMGLKFKRCTKLAFKGNTERNLVLRQQFAF